MLVRRHYDDRLAQATYLIGCQRTGEAIVIDPPRDIAPILEMARSEGVRITRVTETHIHADFVSGARELAAATGATALLSAEGGPEWQYGWLGQPNTLALHDGDRIEMGGVLLTVRHTPGHTPEHIVFLVTDMARSPEPVALVSGDFLFVGDVGRPDLLERAAQYVGTMEQGARDLFRSLQRLGDLPDHLQVWPGHGAGSACGKALGAMPSSTLGYERLTNWAFSITDEAQFVAAVLEGQPAPPVYFAMMKQINKAGAPLLGTRTPLPAIGAEALSAALAAGPVVDIRPAAACAAGHLRGALNIPLNKSFTTWSGWLLGYDRPIHLIAESAAQAESARTALASIGLDQVAGWFAAADLLAAPALAAHRAQARHGLIGEAPALLAAGRTVIDIREVGEWQQGHIEGAVHHPLGRLATTLADLPRDTPLAIHCQAGGRSAIGASVLEAAGFTDVIDLQDGWRGWAAAVATG